MDYREVMRTLSECGLGAVLLSAEGVIRAVNEAGDRLLHGNGALQGKRLDEIAAPLCTETEKPVYANIVFGEYLVRLKTPSADGMAAGDRLIAFRDATNDACHDMLIGALNGLSEAVLICDAESRIWLYNDTAVDMDSIVTHDVRGQRVDEVYSMLDGTKVMMPQVIGDRQPRRNVRQKYQTRFGRSVDVVCNLLPLVQNGQVLGGVNIMGDWSTIDSLHKQIIDLQDKLLDRGPAEKPKAKNVLSAKYAFADIIHISDVMEEVVARCKQAAKTDSSVMIYGETGTGKELFAQSMHNESPRANGPFLAINCAAIPENLLESLLFGTEKGAYTGAERRPGLFEQADGGTLLLDELNSMHINLQSKLLRVLQDGVIRRVGGMSEIQVNVRVLSNINIPPYQAIAENRLRRDLFYRLGVVNINVPPLRERREDIPLLSKRFIIQYNEKLGRSVRDLDQDALERFRTYSWPGNVRELQHAIEHAMNVLPDDQCMISLAYLPEHIAAGQPPQTARTRPVERQNAPLGRTMQELERQSVCNALRESGGNISQAARLLQMSRQNLQYRIRRYQIDVDALLEP